MALEAFAKMRSLVLRASGKQKLFPACPKFFAKEERSEFHRGGAVTRLLYSPI